MDKRKRKTKNVRSLLQTKSHTHNTVFKSPRKTPPPPYTGGKFEIQKMKTEKQNKTLITKSPQNENGPTKKSKFEKTKNKI